MATVHVSHKLDRSAIQALLQSPQGPVARDMLKRGLRVETRAKQLLGRDPKRVDTGRLRASVNTQLYQVNGRPVVGVGTNVKYALYVHEGTGLYGPHGQYIVPKSKQVLRWKTRGAGQARRRAAGAVATFSARSSGMRPNPFLKNALPAAKI